MNSKVNNIKLGFALCGSFCTFEKALTQMDCMVKSGMQVTPIMSQTAFSTDTRFGRAKDINERIEGICRHTIIHTVTAAEPVGPERMFDVLLVAPCTGNTLAKLANGITDTAVTMACKSHLRNSSPLVLAVSTNDALGASAQNIGRLLNCKNIYFVPMKQDDPVKKPRSIVACFDRIVPTLEAALNGTQLQPILL